MFGFLKVFGRGVLYTVLLPFIVLIWVLFTVYNIFLFIVMFFISVIKWVKGGSPFADTKEDVQAKKLLLERQNQAATTEQTQQNKDALIAALASAVALIYLLVYVNDRYPFLLYTAVIIVGLADIDYHGILKLYLYTVGAFFVLICRRTQIGRG